MSEFWRFLLDIDKIPGSVSWNQLEFGWERAFPGWVWGLVLFGAGLLSIWSYSALVGGRSGRGTLAFGRFVFLILLVIVLSGPTLVYPREHTERDWVLMLVDRSQSMTVPDVKLTSGRGRVSRDAQLAQMLRDAGTGLTRIEKAHEVAWLGFDAGTFELDVREPRSTDDATAEQAAVPILRGATGSQTAIGPALAQALRRAAARPVSGVVLFSDGRTTKPPDRALIRRFQAEAIPIFVVPLGSKESLGDLSIREVRAPQRAFIHDKTPVDISLDHLGEVLNRTGAEVSLVDESSGRVFDRRRIERGDDAHHITLTATPDEAGKARWVVRVETDIPDLIEENNTKMIELDLIDRPIRVLFVAGYSRWEYRYVKYLLVREPTIDASVVLLSADRDFAQEGNTPITRLPNSPEELEPYDVVIIGDVYAEFFSPRQLEMLYDHVSERGAGLLWLAGSRANPRTFAGTALAGLLPMRSSAAAGFGPIGVPVTVEPTDSARSFGILNLIDQDGRDAWETLSDPAIGWNQLQWALRIDAKELKPTTEILAKTVEKFPSAPDGLPLVVRMRFGSGQSVFVATDEIWRWRYGRGERLPEQFWVQIIRMLGRDRLATSGRSATLTASPHRIEVGEPAVIELRVFDEKLVESGTNAVPIAVVDDAGEKVGELSLTEMANASGRYRGTYLPNRTGDFNIQLTEPPFNRMDLGAEINVYRRDDEMQNPEADHELLKRLAGQTDGKVVLPSEFEAVLPDLLPRRAVRTQTDVAESIWDTPLVIAVFLFLLTGEWVGRKVMRLV